MSGGGPMGVNLRSYTRDASVTERKLAPGTVRRVGEFAKPFARQITVYLILVVIGAVLTIVPRCSRSGSSTTGCSRATAVW